MNISSPNKKELYLSPELKNILTATENLKREVMHLMKGIKNEFSFQLIIKDIDNIQESLYHHYREISAIEEALTIAFSRKITNKQRILLRWLSENYNEKMIYTVLIERLSNYLGIPKSTVRWNLKGLREAGFIRAGDRNNKGIHVALTDTGKIMAECVSNSSM